MMFRWSFFYKQEEPRLGDVRGLARVPVPPTLPAPTLGSLPASACSSAKWSCLQSFGRPLHGDVSRFPALHWSQTRIPASFPTSPPGEAFRDPPGLGLGLVPRSPYRISGSPFVYWLIVCLHTLPWNVHSGRAGGRGSPHHPT